MTGDSISSSTNAVLKCCKSLWTSRTSFKLWNKWSIEMDNTIDDFTCPRCGKQTIFPINKTNGDFLAVHSVVYGRLSNSYSEPTCEHLSSWCTQFHSHFQAVNACTKAIHDLPKSSFDKNGKLIATKSAPSPSKNSTSAFALFQDS